jgi:hypothetical protein
MDYSIPDIAERLGIHTSVVENYEEEWLAEQESEEEDFITESFTDFLCRTFAECTFLLEAIAGSEAMVCLEAYDETYGNIEGVLTDD